MSCKYRQFQRQDAELGDMEPIQSLSSKRFLPACWGKPNRATSAFELTFFPPQGGREFKSPSWVWWVAMGSPPSNPSITHSQVEGEIWSCKAVGHCCICSLVSEMGLPCVYPAYRPPAHRGPNHHYGSHLDPSHYPPGWSWWWPSSNSAVLHQ